MDVVRVYLAGLHELFNFGDGHPSAHGREWIEVLSGVSEDEVAVSVALPSAYQPEVCNDRFLENEVAFAVGSLKCFRGLHWRSLDDLTIWPVSPGKPAVGHLGADACLRVERRDPHTPSAHTLGERSLGRQ